MFFAFRLCLQRLSLITSLFKTGAILLVLGLLFMFVGWSREATVYDALGLDVDAGVFFPDVPSRIRVLIDMVLV